MSVWSLIGGEASADQKSETGADTREDDGRNASQVFEAGLHQQDRDDENDGNEERRGAEANEEDPVEEEEAEGDPQNNPGEEEGAGDPRDIPGEEDAEGDPRDFTDEVDVTAVPVLRDGKK